MYVSLCSAILCTEAIFFLKFEQVQFTTCLCVQKVLDVANSVDSDQKVHLAGSGLSLHCLPRPVCHNTYGICR